MSLKSNKEFFSEALVGLFMVAVLALLVYFTIIISGVDILNDQKRLPVKVHFTDVGGLKLRDTVVLRGMTVGSVNNMQLRSDGVTVTLLLQGDVSLKEGYRITVNTGSLLGGNYLLIEEGSGETIPRGTTLQGETPNNWMRDLGTIVANLREATEGDHIQNIVTNLDASIVAIRSVVERVEQGEGTLGKLLSSDMSLYNDLSNTVFSLRSVTAKIDTGDNSLARLLNDDGGVYTNLDGTIANLKSISDRLEQGEGTLGKLLSADATVYDDLKDMMANIKSVSARLEKGEGTLGKLLSNDETIYDDLKELASNLKSVSARLEKGEGSLAKLLSDDNKLYNDLDATVANLREVTDRLVKGEGTLGKLSREDELYTEVQGLIKDVRQTVDNFRDTTPISAFASLIMGGL